MAMIQRMVLATMLTVGLAQATWAEKVEVKQHYTDKELVALMKSEGYVVELKAENIIQIKANGANMGLFTTPDGDLQMYYAAEKADNPKFNPTWKDINDWNTEHRFSRAYIDEDGDYVLESDLLMDGGVPVENIKRFAYIFINTSVPAYNQFIIEKSKDK